MVLLNVRGIEMSRIGFENWMRRSGKSNGTINSYVSSLNGISRHYSATTRDDTNVFDLETADLELLRQIVSTYNRGGRYSNIGDTGHGAYRASIKMYLRYIMSNNNIEITGEPYNDENIVEIGNGGEENEEIEELNNFTYESDLQYALEQQAEELFPGYKIFGENNEGIQYNINRRRIDLLLEHKTENKLLVVELKAGLADYKVFGQISMYIGPLMQEYPDKDISGVIIAGEIDESLKDACLTSNKITLKKYQMKITLEEIQKEE
jgi:predicted nuclease of restriction endonuclease-like (RecB) superfamily